MKVELLPFHEELIPQAGDLLAQAHRHDRFLDPRLPVQFEDPVFAREAVRQELGQPRASGVAALRDGYLLGFMIGKTVLDQLWGRSAWVSLAGCAISPAQSADLLGRMYALLGSQWVADGCFTHFVVVPTTESELVQSWFSLSFGIEQVYGLATLEAATDSSAAGFPEYLTIRRGTPADRQVLEGLSEIIWRHQTGAPVWGVCLPEDLAELRQGYAELVDDPEATVWLAFYKRQAAGFQCYLPAGPSGKSRICPENCIELSIAGTLSQFRDLGIGQALTRIGLADAYNQGYRNCLTDWRSTNLLASRFWPAQGFQPLAYRLTRRIDSRIAWAKG